MAWNLYSDMVEKSTFSLLKLATTFLLMIAVRLLTDSRLVLTTVSMIMHGKQPFPDYMAEFITGLIMKAVLIVDS